jgi:hypothetical protein
VRRLHRQSQHRYHSPPLLQSSSPAATSAADCESSRRGATIMAPVEAEQHPRSALALALAAHDASGRLSPIRISRRYAYARALAGGAGRWP